MTYDFCRECGHFQQVKGTTVGLCWVGSEDSGPDEVLKYNWCEEFTREAFDDLHPGVKVAELVGRRIV